MDDDLVGFFGDSPESKEVTKKLSNSGCSSHEKNRENFLSKKKIRRRFSSITACSSNVTQDAPGRIRSSFSFCGLNRTEAELPCALPPEIEVGNVEYKRQLVNLSTSRFEHLVTQLKWRLAEGGGEALYELGVEDDGKFAGLATEELLESMSTLQRMADRLGASARVLRERHLGNGRKVVEMLVRRVPEQPECVEVRVAVLGNVDAGKSTLLGVLTHGQPDDGRGRARLNLFRHLHEVRSGRTSSISREVLGFDADGHVVNYFEGRTLEEVLQQSKKLVTLIDLAGHHKYQRTTLYGLTSYRPHCVLLVVSATTGMVGTSYDHCDLALALGVPLAVVITKVDVCPPDTAFQPVEEWLASPGVRRKPLYVTSAADARSAAEKIHSSRFTPILPVSCVQPDGLGLLSTFLSVLSPPPESMWQMSNAPTELWVDQVYKRVAEAEGPVLQGYVESGSIEEGQQLLLGPTQSGAFLPVQVLSLHRNRLPSRRVRCGQTASVAITPSPLLEESALSEDGQILYRRGMVLVGKDRETVACWRLEARVALFNSCGPQLTAGFQTMVWCGNVCQTAVVEHVMERRRDSSADAELAVPYSTTTGLASHRHLLVIFCFLKHPEYVKEERLLIFRNGRTKGHGEVTRVFHLSESWQPCTHSDISSISSTTA